jgi:hypothetical protein
VTHRSNAATAIGSLTSERTLLEQVRQLARMLGWMTYHPHLSKWSERGWPDVVVCRPPRVLFLELKSETGRVTAEQTQWIDALRACGLDARVVRPSGLDEIAEILR